MQCALASLTLSRPFKRALFPDCVDLLQKKKTEKIKEDRKQSDRKKMLPSVFRFQIEEADQAHKYTMIYTKSFVYYFARNRQIERLKIFIRTR